MTNTFSWYVSKKKNHWSVGDGAEDRILGNISGAIAVIYMENILVRPSSFSVIRCPGQVSVQKPVITLFM